jgi:TonB family protein
MLACGLAPSQEPKEAERKPLPLTAGADQAVSEPSIISQVEPHYSKEAKTAGLQGTVALKGVVHEDGLLHDAIVIHSLGLGLDEAAIECVNKWRFAPGRKTGEPAKVVVKIDVNFRLIPKRQARLSRVAFTLPPETTRPVVVKAPPIPYNKEAKNSAATGTLVVQAVVSELGALEYIALTKTLGFGLDQDSLHTLSQWRFQPAARQGRSVSVPVEIEIEFGR